MDPAELASSSPKPDLLLSRKTAPEWLNQTPQTVSWSTPRHWLTVAATQSAPASFGAFPACCVCQKRRCRCSHTPRRCTAFSPSITMHRVPCGCSSTRGHTARECQQQLHQLLAHQLLWQSRVAANTRNTNSSCTSSGANQTTNKSSSSNSSHNRCLPSSSPQHHTAEAAAEAVEGGTTNNSTV